MEKVSAKASATDKSGERSRGRPAPSTSRSAANDAMRAREGLDGLVAYLLGGEPGLALDTADRDRAAGAHAFDSTRLHRGPLSDAILAAFGARGASAGNHVLIDSRIGGDEFRGVLRHELMHVAQVRGRAPDFMRPLRIGQADSALESEASGAAKHPNFGTPALGDANVIQLDRCPGGCHAPNPPKKLDWDSDQFQMIGKGVPIKQPSEILALQPKTVEAELQGYGESILATRKSIFDQVEKSRLEPMQRAPFGFPPSLPPGILPPDLQERYRSAILAAALVKVGIDTPPATYFLQPREVPLETQDHARQAIRGYYLALAEFADAVGREQLARDERMRAARAQEAASRAQKPIPCRTSCHTPNAPPERSFLPAPPALSGVPALLAKRLPTNEAALATAQTAAEWKKVEADVQASVSHMDELLFAVLPEFSKEREELKYLKQTSAGLEKLQKEHPSAIPIPAVFYPENRWVEEKVPGGKGRTVKIPEAIPWRFYLYHTSEGAGAPAFREIAEAMGEWTLVDLTAPKNPPATYGAAYVRGKDPPYELFSKNLNTKYRFPKGRLHWLYPSGAAGELETTEPWETSDWLGFIGLALAAIALIAGTILTFGLAAPATVPALMALGTAAGIASAGFGIASTVTGMGEKERYGLLTEADKQRAVLSIVFDVIGALALGLGRLASVAEAGAKAIAAEQRVSTFARTLATLNGRYFFMITRAANAMKKVQFAADVTQLLITTHDFVVAFRAIRSAGGLSDSDRETALIKLVSMSLLTGALQTIAVRGGIKDMRAGTLRMKGVDEQGIIDVRATPETVPHGSPKVPELHAPRTVQSHLDAPLGDIKPGWSKKVTGPQIDPELPAGKVEVRLVRDETGQVIGAQTFHHPGADQHSIDIHEDIAKLVRQDGEALRSVLQQQRRAFGGEPPPIEMQLELYKLHKELDAAEKKLAAGALGEAQAKAADVKAKVDLLKHEIDNLKLAAPDPSLHSAYPQGVVGLPVKPTSGRKKLASGEFKKVTGYPDPPEGHIYHLGADGTFTLQPKSDYRGSAKFGIEEIDGKMVASNRSHIETDFNNRKLTAARQAELEALGYVVQKNGVLRRPPGHATAGKPRMVALEVEDGRIKIYEGPETLAEGQARMRAALPKAQVKKLASLEAMAEEEGRKVVLVEGVYDTGATWKQILTPRKRAELKVILADKKMPDKDIDRLIDNLVDKPGTIKVVLGTDPVRAAAPYRDLHADVHGTPRGTAEIHHGDPLYLGGGHDPALLFGMKTKPHDALHEFFDKLTLPASSAMGAVPLQSTIIQNKVKGWGLAKPAAAIVDPVSGAVQFQVLGK